MIDRGITNAAIAAINADESAVRAFAEIDWPGQKVRVHSGWGDRQFMGEEYLGVGEFGGISQVNESPGNSPNQLNLTLTVLDPGLLGNSLNESPEGREVSVHLAVLDEHQRIAHEIPYVFDGNVSRFTVRRGNISKNIPWLFTIGCSDWFERWSQPPENARTTDQAQQHLHPGDRFFSLAEVVAGSPLHALPLKRSSGQFGVNRRGGIFIEP